MIDYALHTNALLIAAELLKANARYPELFQPIAEYHEIPQADMDEIREVIATSIAQMLRAMGEQHRIVAMMDEKLRGRRLL